MWNRGSNKMDWIVHSHAWEENEFQKHMKITCKWWFIVLSLTLALICLPPIAGAFVAYKTPPVGFGCRSLTFILYASTQLSLAVTAIIRAAIGSHITQPRPTEQEPLPIEQEPSRRKRLGAWVLLFFLALLYFTSLTAVLGGTLSQIIGIFRNCICYINAQHWLDLDSSPGIGVASDTQGQRESSGNWIIIGSVATAFMAFNCYAGWWYQHLVRKWFVEEVGRINNYDHNRNATAPNGPSTPGDGNIPDRVIGSHSLRHNVLQSNSGAAGSSDGSLRASRLQDSDADASGSSSSGIELANLRSAQENNPLIRR